MTRLLLAGVVALSGFLASPSANAAECDLQECCVYPYDGGWCAPSVDPIVVCPYDGCWCFPECPSALADVRD